MIRSNIALIGFMGSGKSTAGRLLATRRNKTFLETDALIEDRACMRIEDIFNQFGEERFREFEAQVVAQVSAAADAVISCGGGAVLRPENAALLKASSIVVFLDVLPETVLWRIGPGSRMRPLLEGVDREARVNELMAARRPVYSAVADFTVRTDGVSVDEVVSIIEEELDRL